MTAKVLQMKRSIKEMIDEIHKQFANAVDATKKGDRARIRAGQLLNELRKRVTAGEIGENINWWKWYDENFARSRRDARRVMKLASADDPQAAHDKEKEERTARRHQSKVADDDLIVRALRLVEEMNINQRRQFFAELRRLYADTY